MKKYIVLILLSIFITFYFSVDMKADKLFWEKSELLNEKKFQSKYGLECNKNKHSKMIVKPNVKGDGRNLSPEDELLIYRTWYIIMQMDLGERW